MCSEQLFSFMNFVEMIHINVYFLRDSKSTYVMLLQIRRMKQSVEVSLLGMIAHMKALDVLIKDM